MPLVLTQNEVSATDVDYADEVGASYEYPTMYRNTIKPGELFIYYQGKRTSGAGIQVPHYFGMGKIGPVSSAPNGRLRCVIEDYKAFASVVPFKIGDRYLEPGANDRPSRLVGGFFQRGVRLITQATFDEICGFGLKNIQVKKASSMGSPKPSRAAKSKPSKVPKSAETDVHELAMALARAEAKERWPGAKVFNPPPGLPFSLAVRLPGGTTQHIAVRATAEGNPLVRLTEGDIKFSKSAAGAYLLWVFYAVDVEKRTAMFLSHEGPITSSVIDLAAAVHGGLLQAATPSKKVGPVND